jgi:integration host factor subunit alpha
MNTDSPEEDSVGAGKNELIDYVSERLDTTKKDARIIVETVAEAIVSLTGSHRSVRIPSLGKFHCLDTGPRYGRNPRTGEQVPIAPGRRVTFRAARSFKSLINGPGELG